MASKVRRRVHPQNLPEVRRNEELDELFVFGYACKLFRDDARALEVNGGRTLIPWMGKEKLLIDRYDGRGHLFDLDPFDADLRGHLASTLSDEEKRIEALCDEERYLELHTDIMEKAAYEEEELKRLNEALSDNSYSAVAFNYDMPAPTEETTEGQAEDDDSEEEEVPFECPEELRKLIPEKFMMPETVKLNSIIEKTALFVSQHGPQMEIVIKTKQQYNTNFHFLDMDHSLNMYYKKLVALIKAGKYRPKPPEPKRRKRTQTTSSQESDEDDDDDGSYLHPSLMAKPKTNAAKALEPVCPSRYKLSSDQVQDTAYAKLMNKINQLSGQNSPQNDVRSTDSPVPINSGADAEGNPRTQDGQPAPPGTEATVLPEGLRNEAGVLGSSQSLVQPSNIIPPPPDLQPIIDKMAEYVARNGVDFENTVRNKNDVRFEFLNEGHVFYTYYMFKKAIFETNMAHEKLMKEHERLAVEAEAAADVPVMGPSPAPDSTLQQAIEDDKSQSSESSAKISVSFSIKPKPKEPETVTIEKRPAFIDESSDEEGDEGKEKVERHEESYREKSMTPVCQEFDGSLSGREDIETRLEEKITSSEELDKKLAEHKIKDRLAMAAREKLAQTSKEKQMQAARKRKAAMFINMLKTSGVKLEENTEKATAPISGSTTPIAAFMDSRSQSPFSFPASLRSSPSKSPEKEVKKSRDPDSHKKSKKSPKKSKSRRHRSRSPRRRRSKTPPSAYTIMRRSRTKSRSPKPDDGAKSRERHKRKLSKSKSRSLSRERLKRRHSKSPTNEKKATKSHSPSKRKRSRSRSKSRKTSSSTKGSSKRHRSRSKSKEKSKKHRSRSHSKEKSESKTKSEKKSSRKRSRSKSPKSKESRHKSSKRHRSRSPKDKASTSKSPKAKKHRSKSPKAKKHRSRSPKAKKHRSKSPKAKKHRSKSPKSRKHRSKSPKSKESRSKSHKSRKSRSKSPKSRKSRSKSSELRKSRSKSPESRISKSKSPELRKSRSMSPQSGKSRSKSPKSIKSRSPLSGKSMSPIANSRSKTHEMRKSRSRSPIINSMSISPTSMKSRSRSPVWNSSLMSPTARRSRSKSPRATKSVTSSPMTTSRSSSPEIRISSLMKARESRSRSPEIRKTSSIKARESRSRSTEIRKTSSIKARESRSRSPEIRKSTTIKARESWSRSPEIKKSRSIKARESWSRSPEIKKSRSIKARDSRSRSPIIMKSRTVKARESRSRSPKSGMFELSSPVDASPERPRMRSMVSKNGISSVPLESGNETFHKQLRSRSMSSSSSSSDSGSSTSASSSSSSSPNHEDLYSRITSIIDPPSIRRKDSSSVKTKESSNDVRTTKVASANNTPPAPKEAEVPKPVSDTKLSMEDIMKMRAMIKAKKDVLKEEAIFDI